MRAVADEGLHEIEGWDTEMIKTQLEETIKEEGRKPEYVVSDNGLIMCKAASELVLKTYGISQAEPDPDDPDDGD